MTQKTYVDSTALLNATCQFECVLGLMILKAILSNTSALSRYQQGKNVDVNNAIMPIKTLRECCDDDNFKRLWTGTSILSDTMKAKIDGTQFVFKEAKAPRIKKPS